MTDSENNDQRLLREQGLAFFGAITASVSHELNNVISIIEQTAGLLDDLLYGARQGRPIEPESLQRIADGIGKQTNRGVGIIGRFNTFAHMADHPAQEYELNQTLSNLTGLCQRFADMKRVKLMTNPSADEILMYGSPFEVQQVLFLCIRHMLDNAERDDSVSISAETVGTEAQILVEGPAFGEDGKLEAYFDLLVSRTGGKREVRSEGGKVTVQIVLPCKTE